MPRKKLDIDEERVAQLAFDGASDREIAALIGCDQKTVGNRFSSLLTKKRAERRVEIRKWQTESAKNGNPTLLIWLGKVELKQVERQPVPSKDTLKEAAEEIASEDIDKRKAARKKTTAPQVQRRS